MSLWEDPPTTSDIHSELKIPGRKLGRLAPKFLEAKTWEHLLDSDMGRAQYGRFVALLVERIRTEESDPDEVRNFVRLIATGHNWDFMRVAIPQIPELKHPRPYDPKHFQLTLLWYQLRRKIVERNDLMSDWQRPHSYEDGLSKEEIGLLENTMFGQTGWPLESPKVKRLFTSMMDMGFPQAAVRQSLHISQELGIDIVRDHQGLPSNLRLPPIWKNTAPLVPTRRNAMSHPLKTTAEALIKAPRRIAPSTDENPLADDSPPAELLREPPLGGVQDKRKGLGVSRVWNRSHQQSRTKKELKTIFTEQLEEDDNMIFDGAFYDDTSPVPMTPEEVMKFTMQKDRAMERYLAKRGH